MFELRDAQQQQLLSLARQSIAHGLRHGQALPTPIDRYEPTLTRKGACFVTLTMDGQLRGCLGSLEAHRPLVEDIAANAFASAFRDPRFPPLTAAEFDRIHIEISVLTPTQEIHFHSEADLLNQIEPFTDGLLLEEGYHRGTFLPLVWKQLPDKKMFLSQLKQKAGLPANYWSDTLRCYRYHTLVFEEA